MQFHIWYAADEGGMVEIYWWLEKGDTLGSFIGACVGTGGGYGHGTGTWSNG
jgi:hypothetical protein